VKEHRKTLAARKNIYILNSIFYYKSQVYNFMNNNT
jgi:hypothetical protein